MARDTIHYAVREAIEKDGWSVTHDPYPIKVGGFEMEIDLGAENILAAQRADEKIAVEVKSFIGLSKVHDFHLAVGQFVDYHLARQIREPERVLYVGITDETYEEVFSRPFAQLVVQTLKMKLIIVNAEKREVTQWIK